MKTNLILRPTALLLLAACTGSTAALQMDPAPADASSPAVVDGAASTFDSGSADDTGVLDSGPAVADAGRRRIRCGNAGTTCDAATEICVVREGGVGMIPTCAPVPAGCESNRTCSCVRPSLCAGSAFACTDGPGEDAIACACLACN